MQDERWEAEVTDSLRPLMPPAMPSARFVHNLDQDVRRAARQRMEELGIQPTIPFEEMVIELRKLVRLVRKTLVPVSPGYEYAQRTGRQLQEQAVLVYAQPWRGQRLRRGQRPWRGQRPRLSQRPRQRQQRWLMFGSVLGSVLSVGGLVAAVLLRKRNNEHDKKG